MPWAAVTPTVVGVRHSTGATVTLAGLIFTAAPGLAAVGGESVDAQVAVGTLEGEDWALTGARIAVAVQGGRLTARLTADSLDLPDFETALRALDVRCDDVVLYTAGLDCRRGAKRKTSAAVRHRCRRCRRCSRRRRKS